MMNCKQATRLLSDAHERELPLSDRVALKFHTMMCTGCHNFGKQMGTLSDIAHKYAKESDNDTSPGQSDSERLE